MNVVRRDWHDRYRNRLSTGEVLCQKFTDYFFTLGSLAAHAVVYTAAMTAEGGGFQVFLVGISIEAIFATLLVGIGQKAGGKRDKVAQEQRDHLQDTMEALLETNNKETHEVHGIVSGTEEVTPEEWTELITKVRDLHRRVEPPAVTVLTEAPKRSHKKKPRPSTKKVSAATTKKGK